MASSQPWIVDSSDDDLPVPIMRLNELTDALLDGQYGSPPRQSEIEEPGSVSTTDGASSVCSIKPYEQMNKMGQPAPSRKSHSNQLGRVPTNRLVRLQARGGQGERWNTSRTTSCVKQPMVHEQCEQSTEQSSKGSFPHATHLKSDTERNMKSKGLCNETSKCLPLQYYEGHFVDEGGDAALVDIVGTNTSNPQLVGRNHATPINEGLNSSSSTRLSGTSLRRPARRYKRVPTEVEAVLEGDFISNGDPDAADGNLAKDKDSQDCIEQQIPVAPLHGSLGQQTECVNPQELPTPIHHENANPAITERTAELPHLRSVPPSIYSRATVLSPTFKRTQEIPERHLSDKSANDRNGELHKPVDISAPPSVPPRMTVLETATTVAGAAATSRGQKKRNMLMLNNKLYKRLDCIGRGGSARVYRVLEDDCTIRALKKVSLRNVDEIGIRGFKGEIDLLRKLAEVERVVKLLDWEFNGQREDLSLVCSRPLILTCGLHMRFLMRCS